jgi:hypothetical protein
MKKKYGRVISAILVMTFLLFFLTATIFRKKSNNSYQENRQLTEFPTISLSALSDGSYIKNLGNYFADHFAGRSYWLSANGTIEAKVGECIVNSVFISDDMMLDVSEKNTENCKSAAEIINSFSSELDGTVYFAAIPTSSGVYSDELPEYLDTDAEKKQIDSFYSYLDDDIRKIDAYNILKMLNQNYIYYRSDSKWTSYGAYCVYRTVIQKLGFLPITYDKYTVEHISADFRGNLYNRTQYSGIKADIIDIYTYDEGAEIIECIGYDNDGNVFEKSLYDKSFIETNDMYKLYLGDDVPVMKIKTDVNNDRRLLVIKDDTANCFIPFLIQHYSSIDIISPDCLESDISGIIDFQDYEQILFMYGIDSICDENYQHILIQK